MSPHNRDRRGLEPAQGAGMHDLGRDRRPVDGRGRRAALARPGRRGGRRRRRAALTFLQISDSHVGFDKPANPNALGTLEEAIDKIKALPAKPAFMIHTGDITHLSKVSEFDDAEQHHLAGRPRRALRAGRARHHRRRRQALSASATAGHQGRGLVQLRRRRRALRRPRQRGEPQGRRPRQSRQRAARLARGRPQGPLRLDADRGVRPHPALDGLSRSGAGAPTTASRRSACSSASAR